MYIMLYSTYGCLATTVLMIPGYTQCRGKFPVATSGCYKLVPPISKFVCCPYNDIAISSP